MVKNNILVTGGLGFIGSAFIRQTISSTKDNILNIDKMTYAGNKESLESIEKDERYSFFKCDICNKDELKKIFFNFSPNIVINFAAESHVDNSIASADEFIHTNILGTFNLIEISKEFYRNLHGSEKNNFIFHHISTDEVYGSLLHPDECEYDVSEIKFEESNAYAPNSPYSASKAASDHLVRAWGKTYGVPTVITNCSNNYGPYQNPEKLIPLTILNALSGKKIPIYGDGSQIRDWLYVEDHVRAIYQIVTSRPIGETFNIGGKNEWRNIDIVRLICSKLDKILPARDRGLKINSYAELIEFVTDRPGHDTRYSINTKKIEDVFNWFPEESFETGLEKTIFWYINNLEWIDQIKKKNIREKKW